MRTQLLTVICVTFLAAGCSEVGRDSGLSSGRLVAVRTSEGPLGSQTEDIAVLPKGTGNPTVLVKGTYGHRFSSLQLTPNGKSVTFTRTISEAPNVSSAYDAQTVEMVGLAGGEPRVLAHNADNGVISPDGKYLSYVNAELTRDWHWTLFVAPLESGEANQQARRSLLSGTEPLGEPHWAPDSSAVYIQVRHEVRRVPIDGTEGKTISLDAAPAPSHKRSGAPKSLVGVDTSGQLLVSTGISRTPDGEAEPHVLSTLDSEGQFVREVTTTKGPIDAVSWNQGSNQFVLSWSDSTHHGGFPQTWRTRFLSVHDSEAQVFDPPKIHKMMPGPHAIYSWQ